MLVFTCVARTKPTIYIKRGSPCKENELALVVVQLKYREGKKKKKLLARGSHDGLRARIKPSETLKTVN